MIKLEDYFNKLDAVETNHQEVKKLIFESKDFQKKFLEDLSVFMGLSIKEIRINSDSAFSDDFGVGCYNQPYVDRIITEDNVTITVRDIQVPEGKTFKDAYIKLAESIFLSEALEENIDYDGASLASDIHSKMSDYIIDNLDYYNFYFYDFTMKA